jgi:hypothetical protein
LSNLNGIRIGMSCGVQRSAAPEDDDCCLGVKRKWLNFRD